MPALDALQLKLQLLSELDGETWPRFAEFLTDRETVYQDGGITMRRSDTENKPLETERHLAVNSDEFSIIHPGATAHEVTAQIRRSLMVGETYYVAPNMQTLIAAAMESMPPDETVAAWDLPSPQGFVFIPGGLLAGDIRGLVCATDAILWDTYGGKVALTYYVDKYGKADAFNLKNIRNLNEASFNRLPRLTPWSFGGFGLDQQLPRFESVSTVIPPEIAGRLAWEQDPESRDVHIVARDENDEEANEFIGRIKLDERNEAGTLWFVTMVKLMQQTLVSTEQMPIPRAMQRRMMRMKLANSRATVIELRRRKGQDKGDTHFEYSHRFLRRGHWRRQHYKEMGEWRLKSIWIAPQIVGDPSLPLVIRDHVNALVR